MKRLEGKVAIITGGGKGQGQAAAVLFAREGASIIVADWAEDAGRDTVTQIKQDGGKAEFVKVDVSSSKDVQEMIKFAVKTYGRIDVLYNNAGVSARPLGDSGKIIDVPEEAWDKAINVNLKSIFLCCKYAIPEMIKSGGGSIINTSSLAGILGGSGIGPYFNKYPVAGPMGYTAAKGGMIPMSKAIAIGYGANNIRCNVICPGPINTELMKPLKLDDAAIQESVTAAIPRRRLGKVEDIAYAALYLASDESSWVTGIVLPVDGGMSTY